MPISYKLLAPCVALLLVACGGGGGGANPSASASGYPNAAINCEIPTQKQWLRDYMNDAYYWYDKQRAPNDAATGLGQYLDSMLYKPIDRYSFVTNTESFLQQVQEGKDLGWGDDYMVWADSARTVLKFALVEPNSPLGVNGVKRGDEIVSIDGRTPQQLAVEGLRSAGSEADPRNYVLKDSTGNQRNLLVSARLYDLSPVLSQRVISVPKAGGTRTVGYLSYTQFIASGNAKLGEAFNSFVNQGVNELVLDLRYNGGGSVLVARNLASMIGGATISGRTFVDLRYNNKNSDLNFKYPFSATGLPGQALTGLQRLVVLTSQDTASASELIINGLRPHVPQVVLIGDTTYGKPYASAPQGTCGFTYGIIVSELFNSAGQGGYSSGIPATCAASDDLTRELGDANEGQLAAALSYIQTGACPPAARKSASGTASPAWLSPQLRHKFAVDDISQRR